MALSDKDILITPNSGSSTDDPKIEFTGATSSSSSTITVSAIDLDGGTLSFEGSAGQLFSVTNNLTSGSIFSVNDVSGVPSIDVNADGTILLAPFETTPLIGIGKTNPDYALDIKGTTFGGPFVGNSTLATFDPPGGGTGQDTATNVAFAFERGDKIAGYVDGYIRSMLEWTTGSEIILGASGTSLVTGIDLRPGTSGVAKVNGNTIWHAGNDGAGSGLDADNLDGYTWASSGKQVRASDFYADNWFRNYNSGEGLYNENTTQYFYSDSDDGWNIAGGTGANWLRFRDEYNGTIRGYLYSDTASSIGFLNAAAQWGLRYYSNDGTSPNLYFLEEGNETWSGNPPNDQGKIEYHSNRFYIAAGANSTEVCVFRRSGSDIVRVSNSGDITASGNVTAYSDINLKKNIEVIPNALDKVSQIRGVTFDRIDLEDESRQSGVIAQEIEKVLPEVVRTTQDGTKTVAYGNMVGLLIEAIKELKAEVEILKAERN